MLQLVQAILQAAGETLLLFGGQATLLQMTGIEQGGRQRRADLMRQRGDHPAQGGQPLMAGELRLQAASFGQIGEQHQLPRLAAQ